MADFQGTKKAVIDANSISLNPDSGAVKMTVNDRLTRYGHIKGKQAEFIRFLRQECTSPFAPALAVKLRDCAQFLTLRDYYTKHEVRLVNACFCKKHTVCQMCAVRRSAKFLEQSIPKFELLQKQYPDAHLHFNVLTVKNGVDGSERLQHLLSGWQTLMQRKRNKKDYPDTFLSTSIGGLMSVEVTNIGNEWHPHINLLVLDLKKSFDWQQVKDEWLAITGDSHVVHFSTDTENLQATLAETVKYITKFSDLSPSQLFELHCFTRGKRLVRGFGALWGLQMPQNLLDDVLEADLPYIEYVCMYLGKSGYTILRALQSAARASA